MFDIISKKENNSSFDEIFNFITKSSGAFWVIFLVGSIIYEYMYFWTIGHDLLLLFSAGDFIKLTISWLPTLLAVVGIMFWLTYSDFKVRLDAYEKEGIDGLIPWQKADKLARYFFNGLAVLYLFMALFATWEKLDSIRNLTFLFLGTFIVKQIASGRLPLTNRPIETVFLYLFIFTIWISAFFDGINAGIKDVNRVGPVYNINISDAAETVVLIRSIDKGIFYKNPNEKRISFAPWGQIKSIKSPEINVGSKSIYYWARDKFFDK